MTVKGQQWKAAYLPVWLYSYQEVNEGKKLLHYVAVNARTKETMGSIPINMSKLLGFSILIEIICLFATVSIEFDYTWISLSFGFIFFFVNYNKYRNKGARHKHEIETKRNMENIRKVDKFVKSRKGLSNSKIEDANNTFVSGQNLTELMINTLTEEIGGNYGFRKNNGNNKK